MYKLKIIVLSSAVLCLFLLLSVTAYAASSTGTVKCSGYLNIRQSAGTDYSIVGKIYPDTKINIEETSNGWYKITYNGISGWVSGAYVAMDSSPEAAPAAVTTGDGTSAGEKIADYAKKFLGVRYVYGGESPKGFDCSGFTQYVYNKFGIALNRTASTQTSQGTVVSKSNLKLGDLVFFDTNGGHNNVTHVGIYIGNNKFIHAATGSVSSISISSLDESYYARNYMTARRIIN